MSISQPFLFPVSGVETYIFLPPLVMFIISALVSPAGVSGAFILLPFQMSVLGYTAPGVSGTNFIYNIVSIPLGAYQYFKEKRFSWVLLILFLIGTVPGIFLGYFIRIKYLPDPTYFKVFVGLVLLYLGVRCIIDLFAEQKQKIKPKKIKIHKESIGPWMSFIDTRDYRFEFNTWAIFIPSLFTGIIGGAYGIGGGAIMAPYCVFILKLPVYVVGGATLISTWVSSVIAAFFYGLGPFSNNPLTVPDFLLGSLFGVGGMLGIYVGTRLQTKLPSKMIKVILGIAILIISLKYLLTPFI